ncbi:MAG: SNF2 helicase associated domain-containing protein, partial [Verrucomicrobiota bacterium]
MATKFKITERWLGASGGWVEMKAARAIFKRGEVLEATFDGKLLQGSVRMGKRPLRCGLLIRSTTDIDNLCGCAESRRSGILCRHSLAVGLGFIHQAPAESPSAPSRKAARQKEAKEAPSFALPAGPVTVRFPGNTAAMLRRGQSAIQFEVGDEPDEAATTLDLPLLACLEGLGARAVPPMATLNAEQTTTMLQALLGHPRVQAGKESLKIENSPIRLSLQLSAFGDDHVGLKLLLNDPDAVILKGSKAAWVFLEKRRLFLPLRLPELAEDELSDLLATLDSGRSLSRTWSWFFRRVESLENSFVVDSRELEQEPALRTARPTFHLKLEGSLNHLTGRLTASYAGREVEACSEVGEGTFPYVDDNEPMVFWKRNRLAEEEAVARLDGAEFSGPDKKGYRTLRTENAILRFFASLLPDLQQRWKVEIGERFQHVTRKIERVEPQVEFQASAEPGWLEFDVGYGAGEASGLSRQEVQRLLQVGQSHVKRPDGRILAVDLQACEELNEVLRDVQPDQSGGRFRARQAQAAYLGHAIKNKGGDEAVRTEAVAFPEEALVDLKDILRSYQKEGVCWMLGRTRSGLSGILADEMGLGKTLQTLAMLQALEAESEEAAPV